MTLTRRQHRCLARVRLLDRDFDRLTPIQIARRAVPLLTEVNAASRAAKKDLVWFMVSDPWKALTKRMLGSRWGAIAEAAARVRLGRRATSPGSFRT